MRNDDIQPEKILKFSGEVCFLFQSEEEIESFYKHQFPLFEKERDGFDFIFRPGQTEEKLDMTFVASKVEELFREAFKAGVKGFGSFILMGDRGFIIKYEPGNDGINAFKFVSISSFLTLPVDRLKEIEDRFVYNR